MRTTFKQAKTIIAANGHTVIDGNYFYNSSTGSWHESPKKTIITANGHTVNYFYNSFTGCWHESNDYSNDYLVDGSVYSRCGLIQLADKYLEEKYSVKTQEEISQLCDKLNNMKAFW